MAGHSFAHQTGQSGDISGLVLVECAVLHVCTVVHNFETYHWQIEILSLMNVVFAYLCL